MENGASGYAFGNRKRENYLLIATQDQSCDTSRRDFEGTSRNQEIFGKIYFGFSSRKFEPVTGRVMQVNKISPFKSTTARGIEMSFQKKVAKKCVALATKISELFGFINFEPRVHIVIVATATTKAINLLADKHRSANASQESWLSIWQMFYEDPWFAQRLEATVKFVSFRYRRPASDIADIAQEAMIHFARSLQRDPTLGYRSERGRYGAFIRTIIYRCCQKAIRQFSELHSVPVYEEGWNVAFYDQDKIDSQLDLQHLISSIPQPYQSAVEQMREGKTVDEIAKQHGKSKRTIYRWLDQGIMHMQAIYARD